jgi:hypothetical protein
MRREAYMRGRRNTRAATRVSAYTWLKLAGSAA